MYQLLMTALDEAGKNDVFAVAVLTGSGEYYCSRNDLGNFITIPPEGPQKMANNVQKGLSMSADQCLFLYHRFPNHLFIHSCRLSAFSRGTRIGTPPEGLSTFI